MGATAAGEAAGAAAGGTEEEVVVAAEVGLSTRMETPLHLGADRGWYDEKLFRRVRLNWPAQKRATEVEALLFSFPL